MLRSIMECRGKFSHKMLRRAQFASLHFDEMLNFRSLEKDKLTGKVSLGLFLPDICMPCPASVGGSQRYAHRGRFWEAGS
jgi:hypothetical protein